MQLKNQKDFVSGVLFMLAGVCFAWAASKYAVGNALHMGAGYFPLLLGAALTLLGGLVVFKALVFETEDGGRIGGKGWQPMVMVVLASGLFGALLGGVAPLGLPPMGLVVAVLAMVVVASRAIRALRWKQVLVLALCMSASSYLVFVALLGLPLAVWPVFGGG